jgi:hypothetical protein
MRERSIYGGVLALVGLVLVVIQVLHGFQQDFGNVVVLVVDVLPFALAALTLTYTGFWLATNDRFEDYLPVVFAWGAGGSVLFAAVAALLIFGQNVTLGTLDRAVFVAVDNITVGVMVGVLVGLYDARSRRRLDDLRHQRDRIEAFGNRAADVNNYGRALGQATTLDEVSALCVQALGTLLGVTRVAVVDVGREDLRVLDSTLAASDEDLVRAVEAARDQDPASIVVWDTDPPVEVGTDAGPLVTITVGDAGPRTVYIVAVAPRGTVFEDENVELTELLVGHVATALGHVDVPPVDSSS